MQKQLQIYLARNNVQAGPYTLEQINSMLTSNEVQLDDLMWHEGMSSWQAVRELTGGEYKYLPEGHINTDKNDSDTINLDKKMTVDELYGRKPSLNSTSSDELSDENVKKKIIKVQLVNDESSFQYSLASVFSRMLAVFFDQMFFLICLIPMISNIDKSFFEAMDNQNVEKIKEIVEGLPESVTLVVAGLLLGAFLSQILLLTMRGQTIGKLLTGIRILDIKTNNVPSLTNILLLRTIITNLFYTIPLIGNFILMVDVIFMIVDKDRRSLHDKIASTYVAKAESTQIIKDEIV